MRETYYARICWNTRGWLRPSGDAKMLERKSYAAKNGFGHEEWLLNFTWILDDGYHYAFLERIPRSPKNAHRIIDVILWAISESGRVKIGRITNCEILKSKQAIYAFKRYDDMGWIREMKRDVRAVKGHFQDFSPEGIFNVRFKREDWLPYDPYIVVGESDPVSKLKRYALIPLTESAFEFESKPHVMQGSSNLPGAGKHHRAASPGKMVDPYHPVLQAELMKLLQKQFGKENVLREARNVDLTVKSGKRRALIEIKTCSGAKAAIREALGQILEYAYYESIGTGSFDTELFIVGPSDATEQASAYIELLRNRFKIPIRYCSFSRGDQLPKALLLRG